MSFFYYVRCIIREIMKIDFDASNHIVTVTKSGAASVSDIIEFIDKGVALGVKHKCDNLITSST